MMRGLTLTQPWATLMAYEIKRLETRSWATRYCGPVAIHAAAGFPRSCRDQCAVEPYASALRSIGITTPAELPLGKVLAIAELVECRPAKLVDLVIDERERAFGDYSPGRYAWAMRRVRRLPMPVSCRGSLGLWAVRPDLGEEWDREAQCAACWIGDHEHPEGLCPRCRCAWGGRGG